MYTVEMLPETWAVNKFYSHRVYWENPLAVDFEVELGCVVEKKMAKKKIGRPVVWKALLRCVVFQILWMV